MKAIQIAQGERRGRAGYTKGDLRQPVCTGYEEDGSWQWRQVQ